ncbi:MAG: lantibiotic dehydratase family protein [Pseudonocardiaceae bacterium]
MSTRERSRWYHQVDAAVIRATAHTGELTPQSWPTLEDSDDVEQWCAWIDHVWAQEPIADAVTLASPALAERVEAVCRGHRPRTGQVRRMVMSLTRYLVRMRGRATPFGMFAGVAPLRFGQEASAVWTGDQHVRIRADAVWLAGVIARLESCPSLRRRLPVIANDLVFIRGERLVVSWQPHSGDPARSVSAQVSVRHTPAVQTIMRVARSPILFDDLIGELASEIPGTPAAAIEGMLADLVACGVLITGLRPPSTSTDGLAYVLDRIQEAEAGALEEVAPLIEELCMIQTQLEAASCGASSAVGQTGRVTGGRMRALSGGAPQQLMVDLRLGCTVVLPSQVAAEAEAAAGALLRLTATPAGSPAWRDYHTRWVDRYGPGALIPVQQLVDATAGLGFPAHYGRPGRPAIPPQLTARDKHLLALAQQAALDGTQEVVFDERAVDALADKGIDGIRPAPHIELCAELLAPTMAALAEGTFILAVTGVSRSAASMTGRFLDLLPGDDRQRIISEYGDLPGRSSRDRRRPRRGPSAEPG